MEFLITYSSKKYRIGPVLSHRIPCRHSIAPLLSRNDATHAHRHTDTKRENRVLALLVVNAACRLLLWLLPKFGKSNYAKNMNLPFIPTYHLSGFFKTLSLSLSPPPPSPSPSPSPSLPPPPSPVIPLPLALSLSPPPSLSLPSPSLSLSLSPSLSPSLPSLFLSFALSALAARPSCATARSSRFLHCTYSRTCRSVPVITFHRCSNFRSRRCAACSGACEAPFCCDNGDGG